jgi:aspartyl-tRNA(Asn)/glutamyl-tRNA(Gln) amidotransferase subunit B
MLERARAAMPELPADRERRLIDEVGLNAESARLLSWRAELGDLFEAALASGEAGEASPQVVANWVNELQARLGDEEPEGSKVTPAALAGLAGMVASKAVTQGAAKQVLDTLVERGGDPAGIVEREGLGAVGGTDELAPVVRAALEANPEVADKLRTGDMKPIGVIVGYVMKETRGRADGKEVTAIVRSELGLG